MSESADKLLTAIIVAVTVTVIFFLLIGAGGSSQPAPTDFEARANCIVEFDYTHPDADMIDNLVIALEECQ